MNQEDDFYQELDKNKRGKSCCTVPTMILFFIFLLIFTSGSTIYIIKKIKSVNFNVSELSKKVSEINIRNEGSEESLKISFSKEELNAFIPNDYSFTPFKITENQFIFKNKNIYLVGKLVKPLGSSVQVDLLPTVNDEKLKFEVIKISAGKMTLPGYFSAQLEKLINKSLDEKLKEVYDNFKVTEVSVIGEKLVILGSKK